MVHKSQKGKLDQAKIDEHHTSWENNADKGNSYKMKQRTRKYLKQLKGSENGGSEKSTADAGRGG